MRANVNDVAAAIVEFRGADPNVTSSLTAMQLQKLVYYCQGWHVAVSGEALFDARIAAFRDGPVVETLWRQHRGQMLLKSWPGDASRLTVEQARTVRAILEALGDRSGEQLSAVTHLEDPWVRARSGLPADAPSNQEIPVQALQEYFGGRYRPGVDLARQAWTEFESVRHLNRAEYLEWLDRADVIGSTDDLSQLGFEDFDGFIASCRSGVA